MSIIESWMGLFLSYAGTSCKLLNRIFWGVTAVKEIEIRSEIVELNMKA